MQTEVPLPRYLVFTAEGDGTEPTLSLQLAPSEAEYLLGTIIPTLRPMDQSDYIEGVQGILATFARYSYLLYGERVYWCIEWDPGLLTIEFSPSGDLRWCALRSPVPDFGGRTATDAELEAFDEDAPNPQYEIVFTAWDAQTDEYCRTGWNAVSDEDQRAWGKAMRRAKEIQVATLALSEDARQQLLHRCQRNAIWQGLTTHEIPAHDA